MKIELSLYTIVYFAAIVLGAFSAGLLIFSTKNKLANRLLGLLILAISGWLVDAFFRVSGLYSQNANLYFLPIYFSFGFGPLLYFYVRAITNAAFKFRLRYLLHFLPVLMQAGFYWYVALQDYKTRYNIWFNLHLPYTYRIEYDGTWLSLVVYLVLSLLIIKDYQRWLKENYSDIALKMLNWLKVCLLLMVMVCVFWLVEAVLRDARNLFYKYDVSNDLLCLLIYILGIYSYRQANVEVAYQPEVQLPVDTTTTIADAEVIAKIHTAMESGKLYLNTELTLAELAKYIDLPARSVSANINAAFNKPFNSYVNTWRVDEVKRRLAGNDLEKFTLLGIAFECGFNSKTSFNRIFKELTGFSPSEYIKK
ncbi:helix-turn-helix domain-containing protein [Mucilaginibacter psychrotolerans]|uniref:AraC family transcriptional regulator n=1 Tax=Mucilaginibacter psychrotolerans TaxID=1524096 RepID=A0A4Y8S547_9SPHI|nr:helix-turn-helix transcriptional regulator [Mucilaginibacter psychrotolerans]TFF33544.1 AraC family transcriptional regulator [Mucilaginibacter psychrotolerans]